MEVRRYEKGDALRGDWPSPPPKGFETACSNAVTVVLWEGTDILAILIATYLWEGVWTVAMQPSTRVAEFPLAIVREVGNAIASLVNYHKVRKLYTLMDPTNTTYIRWIEFLGFSKEYVMTKAGPHGQDMIGYSKIMEVD